MLERGDNNFRDADDAVDMVKPRNRFAIEPSKEQQARAAWRERIDRNIHVNTDIVKSIEEAFDFLIERANSNLIEGDGIVVIGPSGAGKSHILRRLLRHPALKPFRDEFGPVRPIVAVKAPSPCTLKTLGIEIHKKLTGEELSYTLSEPEIWRRVCKQLHGQNVSIVLVEELQHTAAGRNRDERLRVAETLKNLLVPDPDAEMSPPGITMRPIFLALFGTKDMLRVIKADPERQLSRRCKKLWIKPVENSAIGLKKIAKFLELIEPKLGFPDYRDINNPEQSGLRNTDMLRRHAKAGNSYLGIIAHFLKQASFLAIDKGASGVDREKHFAVAFDSIYGLGPKKNPYLVANIADCPKVPEFKANQKTLLRGNDRRQPDESAQDDDNQQEDGD